MSHKCERKDKKDSHKQSHKTCHKEKFETLDKLKVRDLCVKNLKAVDITTKTITGATGTFDNLIVNNANINNLNVTSLNGRNLDCDNAPFNFSGVITPVSYANGVPIKPDNPGNFNQAVLDDLWNLNVLANAVTNLDTASGRLRNAILNNFYSCETCPASNLSGCTGATGPTRCSNQGYSIFTGSIAVGAPGVTETILTVSALSNETLTDCPPAVRPIQIGQTIFIRDTNISFPTSTIISQLSGPPGGTGNYLITNPFNNYSTAVGTQTMLSLSTRTNNECVNVPLRIYGIETLSVGPTGPCGNIISQIAYNINIANKTLSTRVAAVYVQVGWQVPGATGLASVNIQGLSINTRQFDPSILSFGEQMNNNVLLPTNLINSIAVHNNTLNGIVNAVVQLVVYVEDGIEVLIPEAETVSAGSSLVSSRTISSLSSTGRVQIQQTQGPTSNYAASYVSNPCFPGPQGRSVQISPYVQPPVDQSVVVTGTLGPGGNTLLFFTTGGIVGTVGGYYIISAAVPGIPFSLTLINLGIPSEGRSIAIGQGVPAVDFSYILGSTTTMLETFTQPSVGETVMITIRSFFANCLSIPEGSTIYILQSSTGSIGNLYNVINVTQVPGDRGLTSTVITASRTNNTTNTAAGTVFPTGTYNFFVLI